MATSRTFKTVVLSSGQVLTSVATLVVFAVLSRLLTVRDYGTFMQVMLVYSSALPFMSLGLPQAPFYFLPRYPDRPRGVMLENLVLLLLMGGAFTLFLMAGGAGLVSSLFKNEDLRIPLQIIAPYPLLMLPVLSLPACLLARGRVVQIPLFTVTAKVTMLLFTVGATLVWGTLIAAVAGMVASALVVVTPGLLIMLSSCRDGGSRPTLSGAKEQLTYSIPLGMAGLVGILSTKFNQIVVGSLCTPEEFAIYVNGAFQIPVVAILMSSVRSVLLADFVKMYEEGKNQQIGELWRRATVGVSAILIPIMVFLEILAPEVMRLLFSAKYEAAAIPFRILLLLLVMRSIAMNSVFLASGHSRLVLSRGLISLILNVVLSIGLVKWFGYIGASIGLVIAMYFWATPYSIWKTARILKSSVSSVYPFAPVGKILLASLIGAFVPSMKWVLGPYPDYLYVVIGGMFYFPLVFLLFRYLKISDIPDFMGIIKRAFLKQNLSR